MPFMLGPSPIRRTTKYLNEGRIIFREAVKIFTIHWNSKGKNHEGARKFQYWHLPQIIYKNPNVQCLSLKDTTPLPFIRIFMNTGKSILIDLDGREKEDILSHLENFTAICKSSNELAQETTVEDNASNPAYFGFQCHRHCICEIPGQVPCPSVVRLPNCWRDSGHEIKNYIIPPKYMEPGLEKSKDDDDDD